MQRFIIKNEFIEAHILDYGATLDKLYVANTEGVFENVVLSFEDANCLSDGNGLYLNAFVGPTAGRIKDGRLDDRTLTVNNGTNHLHGGCEGASFQTFEKVMHTKDTLILRLETTHASDGYEGTYLYEVTFHLEGNCLKVSDDCRCDVDTLLYPTHHFYFNLSGNLKHDVTNHLLTSASKEMVYLDPSCAPVSIQAVDEPFDFHEGKRISDIMNKPHEQLAIANGLDHPFLLNGPILLQDPTSGRYLKITSDAKAIVLYNSNFIDETSLFDGHVRGYPHIALAMETQNIPNGYALGVIDKTKHYHQETIYEFGLTNQ